MTAGSGLDALIEGEDSTDLRRLEPHDDLARPGRRSRRQTPAQRRAQIVDAATTLIAEHGYKGISLQQVATACDLTVAGLLHHVHSKEGLLIAVLEHRDEVDLELSGLGRDAGDTDPRALLDALMRHNAAQPEIVRLYTVLNSEALDPTHVAHDYFRRRYQASIDMVADRLDGHVDDPRSAASDLIAIMDGVQLQWLRNPGDFDLFDAWTRLADPYLAVHGTPRDARINPAPEQRQPD